MGGARQQDLMTFLNVFRKVGGAFDVREDGIRFWHPGGPLKPVQVETDVHPGFMTDWQQPLIVALTQAEGVSVVHETVYENRLGFTDALVEMGADIVVHSEGLESVTRRVPRRKAMCSLRMQWASAACPQAATWSSHACSQRARPDL